MTELTQRLPDYDVMMVADEAQVFGDYLPFRTWNPRPVAGTLRTRWPPAVTSPRSRSSRARALWA